MIAATCLLPAVASALLAWTPLVEPMPIPRNVTLYLVLPLCYGVALVYKTIRCAHVADVPRQFLHLAAYMTGGLVALGLAAWLVQFYWA